MSSWHNKFTFSPDNKTKPAYTGKRPIRRRINLQLSFI